MGVSGLVVGVVAAVAGPVAPLPVFLKFGFSSVLDFESSPKRVVIGDPLNFQVERAGNSIVMRPLATSAVTNLFVYFEKGEPRQFVLTASEDAEPSMYRKIEREAVLPVVASKPKTQSAKAPLRAKYRKVSPTEFEVSLVISGNSARLIDPSWPKIFLQIGGSKKKPIKIWAADRLIRPKNSVAVKLSFEGEVSASALKDANVVVPTKSGNQLNFFLEAK